MGRDQEYAWLGLARALESGLGYYLRRTERDQARQDRQGLVEEQQRNLMQRHGERQRGIQRRHEERMSQRESLAAQRAEDKLRRDQGAATTEQDFMDRFGTGQAPDMVRKALSEAKAGSLPMDISAIQRAIDAIGKQHPDEPPPEINVAERQKSLQGAYDEKSKRYDMAPSQALGQALQEAREREAQIKEIQRSRREATRAKEGLRERQRRLDWGYKRDAQQGQLDFPMDPAALQEALRGGQGGGAPMPDGGMGMMPQQPMGLNPAQAMQFPQGENATVQDQAQLGALAKHLNTIMGWTPGGPTMTELAEAYQWFANNGTSRMPVDMELFAQGVPNAQGPRGQTLMQEVLG